MLHVNLLKFKSRLGKHYIFDAISNNIYEVSAEDVDLVSHSNLGRDTGVRSIGQNRSEIEDKVLNTAKTLIVELTEKCNLRCTYCIYDESFDHERVHSSKSSDLEELKRSIDGFYERTDKKEAYLVFYGGEPLLEVDLIKELVEYANNISSGVFKYSVTTNGTLFTKEVVEFLSLHNFKLTVSIDGPRHLHDKNRIYINGEGSWDKLIEGLRLIKESSPEYYMSSVGFNCVISNPEDMDELNAFFADNEFFSEAEIRFSSEIKKPGFNSQVQLIKLGLDGKLR